MKKRLMSLMLAAVMAGTLAGCGGGAGTDTTSADNTAAEGTQAGSTEGTQAGTSAASGQTVIKWAMWDKDLTGYYKPLIEAFEGSNPDIKVEMVDLGSSDYNTVLTTQLTGSGSGFDVVSIKDTPGYTTLVNKGVLEPLDPYIEKNAVDLSGYKGLTDQVRVDGKLYELPFKSDFWVIYYNKDVFDKAGVAYPSNDMTFAQYDELARKISNTIAYCS